MTAEQARALLELLADLYRIASQPDPDPAANGAKPEPVRTAAK
jgi:hypothetical protein